MEYLIIGGGVAGTTAALNIRKSDPEGDITVLSDESYPFYSRIRLMDFLAGDVDEERLIIHKADWYGRNRIKLVLDSPALSVDTEVKEVLTAARTFKYDRLLIAAGGRSFIPPIPGADKEGVFTLRDIKDAKAIRGYAEGVEDVLLIGGGVLGLEAGNALRKRGKKIYVLEFFDRLLPRQMDPEGARILTSQMEGMGFRFYLGARTKEITGGEKAAGVLLEDGRRIDAGMILISAGVRANLSLAQTAGVKTGKGIVVNDRMETSRKDVYAAGDAAEHRGVCYGIWPAAEKQGEVAGINMTISTTGSSSSIGGGRAPIFQGITPSNILKVAGIELVSAGNIDAGGKCEHVVHSDRENYIYRKLVIEEDRLSGCILLGAMEGRRKILKAIDEKRNVASLREELKRWDLSAL